MINLLRAAGNTIAPLGIPLAWKQLAADPKRLVTAVIGVAFGITLMLFQLGLYNAINAMVVLPHAQLRGDLYLTSLDWESFGSNRGFTRRRLSQARALPEVESVTPLYIGFVYWTNPETGLSKVALTLAFDPSENPFKPGAVRDQSHKLQDPEAVLFDALSSSEYGRVPELLQANPTLPVEIDKKHAMVKGLFTMGPTLAASANLVMSDEAWFRYRTDVPRNMANVGVINLRPGTNAASTAAELRLLLPKDVRVVTREAFIREEQAYWDKRTPVGFVVGAGMLVGMLVGAIVVYQILYSDVNDHLKEYATLKAIGMGDLFFTVLVLEEALLLVVMGAPPALALTALLNSSARSSVNLPAYVEPVQVLTVLLAVAVACLLAGQLATRKLRAADPASVF
jgi:putative ABC transport system permease protein